jgi:hypothetical protein
LLCELRLGSAHYPRFLPSWSSALPGIGVDSISILQHYNFQIKSDFFVSFVLFHASTMPERTLGQLHLFMLKGWSKIDQLMRLHADCRGESQNAPVLNGVTDLPKDLEGLLSFEPELPGNLHHLFNPTMRYKSYYFEVKRRNIAKSIGTTSPLNHRRVSFQPDSKKAALS